VITETNAIYFKTGSAELDKDSEPLLDTGADIAKRCPSVKFEVDGHTDSIGPKSFNQTLSEQRAKSVVDYLAVKGVSAARIHAVGYGDTRPVVPNTSEANRAKNRRDRVQGHKGIVSRFQSATFVRPALCGAEPKKPGPAFTGGRPDGIG
jgi:OmpA-OmpF porin, OOP family